MDMGSPGGEDNAQASTLTANADAGADAESSQARDEQPPPPRSRTRPKIDLSGALGGSTGERRKGKSMFGVLLGTLNKAKLEDRARSSSEAVRTGSIQDIHT